MTAPGRDPGFRLRQIRERLGLTYRDVERASLALARAHTRPQFTLHISRLADIENGGVVPSVHKLYALAVVYHLDPVQILGWYDVPLERFLGDAVAFHAPRTHLIAAHAAPAAGGQSAPAYIPEGTEFLTRNDADYGELGNMLNNQNGHHRYGCIGLRDRRMEPILRPGSIVLVDVSVRRLQEGGWTNEYDRPMYFVELHEGYRCGWFQQDGTRLAMQPHPLSRCMPESWLTPADAEIVGRVVGIVTRLPGPLKPPSPEFRESRERSNKKAL